eukprot:TRINITY_DN19480_c0_g1_i1.p2 TRINITY_DN19480_c0_g1~~TRINITY_DN19480_c0_g1_i1.p2  ORF type:complete len:177 (-),score=20.02 TRINITY_DN19480_c0_g1_i1:445-942(-)
MASSSSGFRDDGRKDDGGDDSIDTTTPNASSVPIPTFMASDGPGHVADTDWQSVTAVQGEGQNIDRVARILRTSPREEVQSFLQEVAISLLTGGDAMGKLTSLGGRLSQDARNFLHARKIGLKGVLLCHSSDFRLEGEGSKLYVTYLHDSLIDDWQISYQVVRRL